MNDPSGVSKSAATIPDHALIVRIGGGSYGEVWLARSALGATRAVKIINRKSFEDDRPFEREFNGIQRFEPISRSHDGLVDILQVGRQQEYFYYVMELADDARPNGRGNGSSLANESKVPGASGQVAASTFDAENYVPRTLRQNLNDNGRLPVNECVEIGLALTSALAHMHRHGLVHRDIKPSNIIFVQGAPKLADIGLVTEADTTLSYVGTEGYIPPEGPGAIQADIFSLGKVLYEMATGQDRRQFPDLPTALNEWPDRAAVLEVNEVLLKACARDVRERYQNCEELHADLLRLQRGQSVKRHHRWQRRRGFLKTYGLVAAAVGLLIFAGLYVNRVRRGHVPDPKAEREYKLGQWYYGQLTPEDHKKAMQHLRQATEIDPRFVLPYRELIALYVWGKAGLFPNDEEKERELKQIADKLLAMNSKLGEGHTALSWWHFLNGDVRAAEGEIVQAIDHDPSYPIARDVYTYYLCMLGRPAEAHQQAERAQELDPTARTSGVVAAWPFFAARQFDQAIAQIRRVLELDKNFPEALNFLARCYEAQSNYVAAIETWKKADLMTCQNSNRVIAGYAALRQAYDTDGERGYFRKYIDLIREDEALPDVDQVFFVVDVAGYYARLGETERALDEIEQQLHKPNVRAQLKFEPLYDTLYDHPRFKELLKRAGIEP